MIKNPKKNSQWGGVALEYVMVTTFAAVLGAALLGVSGKVLGSRLDMIREKLGLEVNLDVLDLFGDGNSQ